jgi:tetratricopeptide (TPR) repeat protein
MANPLTRRLSPQLSSDTAATVGDLTRRGRGWAVRMPGVTAVPDLIAARHCVDLLSAGVKETPADARRYVWLAEALLRVRRDMQRVAAVRAFADPSSILVRAAIGRAAALGEGADTEDPAVRLLRRAFHLAGNRLHRSGADVTTLHVLARVYLNQGRPADALRLARLAAATGGDERADALLTAARAFANLGRREDARLMAERAVEHGQSLGYEVVALLVLSDPTDLTREAAARAKTWHRLRRQVRAEDRARYCGAVRMPAEVASAVTAAQVAKLGSVREAAEDLADRARAALSKEVAHE